jgi:two-component system response regulator NreC
VKPTRVVVVDDHTLIRQGMVGLLDRQADIEVVGEAGNGRDGIELVERLRPDVVLMDVAMPGISGLDATRELKSRLPDVPVIMLTIHDRDDYIFEALRAGAVGYVLKGADVQDLLAAVRSARRGEVFLQPDAIKSLVADFLRRGDVGEDRQRLDGLSDREREILRLIAQGQTTPEIAASLGLSPHTIGSHRERIMTKLDLHSKTALVKYAIARGLIDV